MKGQLGVLRGNVRGTQRLRVKKGCYLANAKREFAFTQIFHVSWNNKKIILIFVVSTFSSTLMTNDIMCSRRPLFTWRPRNTQRNYSCLVIMCSRRPLFTWRPRSSDSISREVRLFKMAVLARICLLVLAICPAVRAQGRAGSFVTPLELLF